jgi:hypothetical protein
MAQRGIHGIWITHLADQVVVLVLPFQPVWSQWHLEVMEGDQSEYLLHLAVYLG